MKIYACEKNFLAEYLDKTENFNPENTSSEKMAIFFQEQKERSSRIMSVSEGVARIAIQGPLSMDGPTYIDWLFGYGGTAYTDIMDALKEAESNDDINKIILEMDTPGGHVDGVDSVHMAIRNAKKEVIAENHGMIASAGYWIASAAKKIVAKEQTSETGSIGVIIAGLDYKEARKNYGVKLVRIISKNAPNKAATLEDPKGIKLLQERVDTIERIFLQRVAEGRKITTDDVIKKFGQGNVFIALDPDTKSNDALSVGMIDSLEIGEDIVTAKTRDAQSSEKKIQKDIDESVENNQNEDNKPNEGNMNLSEYLEKNPAAKSEISKMVSDEVAKITAKNDKTASEAQAKATAEEKTKANIEGAKKYLTKDYPQAIQDLAVKVISGEQELTALEAAANAVDTAKEAANISDAEEETNENGEVTPEPAKSESENGEIKSEEDFEASVERIKKAQGRS